MDGRLRIIRAYRYRLDPTSEQETSLERFAGARRWVYNWALEQRENSYRRTGTAISWKELSAKLPALKAQPETAWLAQVNAQLLQQSLADLRLAYANFFARRAGKPHFKSKKRDAARFRIPQRVKLIGASVIVPKIGEIALRLSRPVQGIIKSATFKRSARGCWYLTLVAHGPVLPPVQPISDPAKVVAYDVGVRELMVGSDGMRVGAPRWYRHSERRLRRLARRLSRAARGSRNRAKARCAMARLHDRIAARRNDYLHKITTAIARQVQAACIEDLHVKGLARTKLSKSVLDAAPGELRRQLSYKLAERGKPLAIVDRWFPSSRRCSLCGWLNRALGLGDRAWACPRCGAHHDRDVNAAANLRAAGIEQLVAQGLWETKNACGEHVRPRRTRQGSSKQEGPRANAGIPVL